MEDTKTLNRSRLLDKTIVSEIGSALVFETTTHSVEIIDLQFNFIPKLKNTLNKQPDMKI